MLLFFIEVGATINRGGGGISYQNLRGYLEYADFVTNRSLLFFFSLMSNHLICTKYCKLFHLL
jgi:hypothetical protein